MDAEPNTAPTVPDLIEAVVNADRLATAAWFSIKGSADLILDERVSSALEVLIEHAADAAAHAADLALKIEAQGSAALIGVPGRTPHATECQMSSVAPLVSSTKAKQ
ncbi:MAG: hypothetical protein J0I21_11715 [Alphaproteobacteria bacterium]|nr:hypothetical protein [Alphaproteobacteria bacterium]